MNRKLLLSVASLMTVVLTLHLISAYGYNYQTYTYGQPSQYGMNDYEKSASSYDYEEVTTKKIIKNVQYTQQKESNYEYKPAHVNYVPRVQPIYVKSFAPDYSRPYVVHNQYGTYGDKLPPKTSCQAYYYENTCGGNPTNFRERPVYNPQFYDNSDYNSYYYEPQYDWHARIYNWNY
ncbi:hypothetical protein KW805_00690 [Candidatus Pacearchaeota archaeon]|nr:hypothetical protein [Candidatus Pacearchaeota archaeon]